MDANDYFNQAMKSLASELQNAGVKCEQLILETRPPIGMSVQLEEGISDKANQELGFQAGRQELGFRTGEFMFEAIHTVFSHPCRFLCRWRIDKGRISNGYAR
eukprot:scaffold7278_cov155-Skeletonema_menzelii.AAC.7